MRERVQRGSLSLHAIAGTLAPKPLRTDDWWRDYFGGSSRSLRRQFFA